MHIRAQHLCQSQGHPSGFDHKLSGEGEGRRAGQCNGPGRQLFPGCRHRFELSQLPYRGGLSAQEDVAVACIQLSWQDCCLGPLKEVQRGLVPHCVTLPY